MTHESKDEDTLIQKQHTHNDVTDNHNNSSNHHHHHQQQQQQQQHLPHHHHRSRSRNVSPQHTLEPLNVEEMSNQQSTRQQRHLNLPPPSSSSHHRRGISSDSFTMLSNNHNNNNNNNGGPTTITKKGIEYTSTSPTTRRSLLGFNSSPRSLTKDMSPIRAALNNNNNNHLYSSTTTTFMPESIGSIQRSNSQPLTSSGRHSRNASDDEFSQMSQAEKLVRKDQEMFDVALMKRKKPKRLNLAHSGTFSRGQQAFFKVMLFPMNVGYWSRRGLPMKYLLISSVLYVLHSIASFHYLVARPSAVQSLTVDSFELTSPFLLLFLLAVLVAQAAAQSHPKELESAEENVDQQPSKELNTTTTTTMATNTATTTTNGDGNNSLNVVQTTSSSLSFDEKSSSSQQQTPTGNSNHKINFNGNIPKRTSSGTTNNNSNNNNNNNNLLRKRRMESVEGSDSDEMDYNSSDDGYNSDDMDSIARASTPGSYRASNHHQRSSNHRRSATSPQLFYEELNQKDQDEWSDGDELQTRSFSNRIIDHQVLQEHLGSANTNNNNHNNNSDVTNGKQVEQEDIFHSRRLRKFQTAPNDSHSKVTEEVGSDDIEDEGTSVSPVIQQTFSKILHNTDKNMDDVLNSIKSVRWSSEGPQKVQMSLPEIRSAIERKIDDAGGIESTGYHRIGKIGTFMTVFAPIAYRSVMIGPPLACWAGPFLRSLPESAIWALDSLVIVWHWFVEGISGLESLDLQQQQHHTNNDGTLSYIVRLESAFDTMCMSSSMMTVTGKNNSSESVTTMTTMKTTTCAWKVMPSVHEVLRVYFLSVFGTTTYSVMVAVTCILFSGILSFAIFHSAANALNAFHRRFLYAKYFSKLTSSRRARSAGLPHFRLYKVDNLKVWLSLRARRTDVDRNMLGPYKSIDTTANTLVFVAMMCVSISFARSVAPLLVEDDDDGLNLPLHVMFGKYADWFYFLWSIFLGIFMFEFTSLASKTHKKYENTSVLLTEQLNVFMKILRKPQKKDELNACNNMLKVAIKLLRELEGSGGKKGGPSGALVSPYIFNLLRVVLLSAAGALSGRVFGFKVRMWKL